MGIVELECGPHLVTAAITRDAIEQLGLEPGVEGDGDGQGDLGHGDRGVRRFEAAARVAAPVDGQKRLRYRRKCPLIVVTTSIALALAAAGCGGDDDEGEEEAEELTVSAASSLTEAFEAYGSETEIEEKFSFAGSDDLAAQIREGAPVDVFASANTSLPDALFEEGLVDEPTTFIANELVLAVPAGLALCRPERLTKCSIPWRATSASSLTS